MSKAELGFETSTNPHTQHVIHLLLERQYQLGKQLLVNLDKESHAQEETVVQRVADRLLKRRNVFSLQEREQLTKINSLQLPLISFEPIAGQLKSISTSGSAPSSKAVVNMLVSPGLMEDVGPSEQTVFASRRDVSSGLVSFQNSGGEDGNASRKRQLDMEEDERKKFRM
jgi:hypothetical protein